MELIKQNSQTQIIKSLIVIFIGSIILAETVRIIEPIKTINNDFTSWL